VSGTSSLHRRLSSSSSSSSSGGGGGGGSLLSAQARPAAGNELVVWRAVRQVIAGKPIRRRALYLASPAAAAAATATGYPPGGVADTYGMPAG